MIQRHTLNNSRADSFLLNHLEASPQMLVLHLEEHLGINRVNEPVTIGLPFQQGMVARADELLLYDEQGSLTPLQVQVLAKWRDDSIQWALIDFQANVLARQQTEYILQHGAYSPKGTSSLRVTVQQTPARVVVDTGRQEFFLNTRKCKPFDHVLVEGKDVLGAKGSRIVLRDSFGREYEPYIQNITVEAPGPLRATLSLHGRFQDKALSVLAEFMARLSFYARSSVVKIEFTIRNSRAARHPGGFWDLGDEGSIFFRDLSLQVPVLIEDSSSIRWTSQPGQSPTQETASKLEIYQDSSGGPNWDSPNHVNRSGKITTSFRGYRVTVDGQCVDEGVRAAPTVVVGVDKRSVAGTIAEFWQNFPKAIEAEPGHLNLALFPHQCRDPYELQGGEQKTHTLFLQFSNGPRERLDWVHEPLFPRSTPEWFAKSGAFPYLLPRSWQDPEDSLLNQADDLVDSAVTGAQTFFDKREFIDEYGWRHYGDLYADHEAVNHRGSRPFISHYNNQYDVIYGAIVQYARTGEVRWYTLAIDLARHVIDIDLYHTASDRPVFNGGLFWHTEHYKAATTSTHRSYSKANIEGRATHLYGGGPACEHNYATGLLYYYYLTGDTKAKEAICSLADWVINMDEAPEGILSFLDKRPTGLCSATADRGYHGPGRGSGNSIRVLLDAFSLSCNVKYKEKAEQLIRRCIHPKDDIEKRDLADIEHRWSYTVFLQVLGKYLDFKVMQGEIDYMYSYAKASLLHYATWMLTNEVPYKQILYKVEIPTETWPAQDVRKSNVLDFAAKYSSGQLRNAFLQKAEDFFRFAVTDLLSFETCTLTRPVVLMMTNVYMYPYCRFHLNELHVRQEENYDFGRPTDFTPRFAEIRQMREILRVSIHAWKGIIRGIGVYRGCRNTERKNEHG